MSDIKALQEIRRVRQAVNAIHLDSRDYTRVEVGGFIEIANNILEGEKITNAQGHVYLRSGSYETDTRNFSEDIWGVNLNVASGYDIDRANLQSSDGCNGYDIDAATGTTIVALHDGAVIKSAGQDEPFVYQGSTFAGSPSYSVWDVATDQSGTWLVGGRGKISKSIDNGETWGDVTPSQLGSTQNVWSIEFYSGNWYKISQDTNTLTSSLDGEVWSEVSSHVFGSFAKLVISDAGIFIVHDSLGLHRSDDGTTWQTVTSDIRSSIYSPWPDFYENQWVVSDGVALAISYDDALSFTEVAVGSALNIKAFANNGKGLWLVYHATSNFSQDARVSRIRNTGNSNLDLVLVRLLAPHIYNLGAAMFFFRGLDFAQWSIIYVRDTSNYYLGHYRITVSAGAASTSGNTGTDRYVRIK